MSTPLQDEFAAFAQQDSLEDEFAAFAQVAAPSEDFFFEGNFVPDILQAAVNKSIAGDLAEYITGRQVFESPDLNPVENFAAEILALATPGLGAIKTFKFGAKIAAGAAKKAASATTRQLIKTGVKKETAERVSKAVVQRGVTTVGAIATFEAAATAAHSLSESGRIDLLEVSKEAGKGAVIGFFLGAAGGAAGLSKTVSKTGARLFAGESVAEIAAATVVAPALEGRLPDQADLVSSAAFILGIRGAGLASKGLSRVQAKVVERIKGKSGTLGEATDAVIADLAKVETSLYVPLYAQRKYGIDGNVHRGQRGPVLVEFGGELITTTELAAMKIVIPEVSPQLALEPNLRRLAVQAQEMRTRGLTKEALKIEERMDLLADKQRKANTKEFAEEAAGDILADRGAKKTALRKETEAKIKKIVDDGTHPMVAKDRVQADIDANVTSSSPAFNEAKMRRHKEVLDDASRPDKPLTVEGARMRIEDSAKRTLEEISAANPQTRISWDESTLRASGMSIKEATKIADIVGGPDLPAATVKLIQNLTTWAADTRTIVGPLDPQKLSSSDIAGVQFVFENLLGQAQAPAKKLASGLGRGLNILQKATSPQGEGDLAKLDIDWSNPKQVSRLVELFQRIDPSNPKEVAGFVEALKTPGAGDLIESLFYNSILSNPSTHIVNVVSTAINIVRDIPTAVVRATIDAPVSKLRGKERQFYLDEALPMFTAFMSGIKTAVPKTIKMIREGNMSAEGTKLGIDISPSARGAFSRAGSEFIRRIAPGLELPSNALIAEDIIMRGIAFDMKMAGLSRRAARKGGARGADVDLAAKEILVKPPSEMVAEAQAYAQESIFVNKPGKIGDTFLKFRNAFPFKTGKLIVPFVRTIGNLLKQGIQLTPGVGVLSEAGRLKRGEVTGTEVAANQVIGGLISIFILQKYVDGEVTGAVPLNRAKADAFWRSGKQPHSLKIGNTWVSYRRIEPINLPIASVVAVADTWSRNPDADISKQVFNTIGAIGRNITDASYFAAVGDLVEIWGRGEDNGDAIKRFVLRFPGAFVPFSSLLRGIARATEVLVEGEATVRRPRTLKQQLQSQLPGMVRMAPPKRNVWGDVITIQGGSIRQFLPYKWLSSEIDELEAELSRLHSVLDPPFTVGFPSKKFGDVELTDEEYDAYLVESGQAAKEKLFKLIEGHRYARLSDTNKAKAIRRIIDRERKKSRLKITKRAS